MKISNQDLIAFLNANRPNGKYTTKNIEQSLYFALLWNAFEGSFFSDNVELTNQTLRILAECNPTRAQIEERYIDELYDVFKNRYVTGNQINDVFDKLRFLYKETTSNKDAERFVKNSLLSESPSRETKLRVLLLIIYRFRNNLFHGIKSSFSLNKYEEIFGSINAFLIRYITSLIKDKINIRKTLSMKR